jgi:hypothetical protein
MLGEENYPHCHSLQRKTIDSFPLLFRSRMNPWPADLPQVPMDGGGCGSGGQPVVEPRPLPSESHCGRPQASSMAGLRARIAGEDWGKGDGESLLARIRARGMASRRHRLDLRRPREARQIPMCGAWVNPSVSPLPRARSAGL